MLGLGCKAGGASCQVVVGNVSLQAMRSGFKVTAAVLPRPDIRAHRQRSFVTTSSAKNAALYASAEDAVKDIRDGAKLLVGGE